MDKKEAEILAHLVEEHLKKETKALKDVLRIDDELSIEIDEKKIEVLQEVREVRRKRAMKHREWLREIAPLLGCEIVSFGGRGHDKVTGIKVIVPTKFREVVAC